MVGAEDRRMVTGDNLVAGSGRRQEDPVVYRTGGVGIIGVIVIVIVILLLLGVVKL
jgi:hypothetical protein